MKTFLNFVLFALMLTSASFTKLKTSPAIRGHFVVGHIYQPLRAPFAKGALNGIILTFTFADNNKIVRRALVNADGSYSVTLGPGRWIRRVVSPNFKPYESTVCMRSNSKNANKHNITVIPVQPPVELFIVRGFIKNMVTNKLMEDDVLKSIKAQVNFQNLVTKERYNAEILPGAIYTVKLPAGQYIRQSSGVKYAVMDDKITIKGNSNENVADNIVFLSQEINGYRAILTWGKLPQDLDAHVVLPEGLEVNFDNKVSRDKHVTLDVDNTKGYGPEVVSFEDLAPGVYKYYVNKFSNEAALTNSQAVVRLLKGARVYGTYKVPAGDQTLDNWHVFNIDQTNGTVEVINQLKDQI